MAQAFIVDAVRTPVGKRGGALAEVHSADLAAHTIAALVERTGIDPGAVDDVILGCCDTIGSQAGDVARTAWLVAGLPDHVPGVTIDRQCGSSQQAVHFAAQGVMSGTQDLVVAGGLQNMSAIPISAAMLVADQYGFTTPFAESPGWVKRYGDVEVSQFNSAEMIAEKWDVSRVAMEEFALEWAAEINTKSPTAIKMLKYGFNLPDDGLVGQQLFAGEATRLAYGTEEAQEGRDAFVQKRKRNFKRFPWTY